MSRSRVREGAELDATPAELEAARSRSRSRAAGAKLHHGGEELPIASGRGGLGNVSRSESKDPARERQMDLEDERVEKDFERKHAHDEHLAGRGGMGNAMHHGHK